MTRIKRGVAKRSRRKKIIKRAKGYKSHRKTNYRAAMEALLHAGTHAFRGRKQKKRDMRGLWNIRISAAAKINGTSYSKLMGEIKKADIQLNRKMLSELAATKPEVFKQVVEQVKK
jgi:large subunit ribosomal protein L20